jgi:predicted SAM-dependent methyltransferase
MKRYLNLGCGNRYCTDWINIDFSASGKSVISHDLRSGIPLDDESVEFIYHSHLLEHFAKLEAQSFLRECHRVLSKEGVIRIAVPDLERIAREYLQNLGLVREGNPTGKDRYDWIMLELLDQTVRNEVGGEMLKFAMSKLGDSARKYIYERCGIEGRALLQYGDVLVSISNRKVNYPSFGRSISAVIRRLSVSQLREKLFEIILGKEYMALELGRFRLRGEIHQWMYDSYSLERLLQVSGFRNIMRREAVTSYLDGWSDFNLDTESNGEIYKPDSIYLEAMK